RQLPIFERLRRARSVQPLLRHRQCRSPQRHAPPLSADDEAALAEILARVNAAQPPAEPTASIDEESASGLSVAELLQIRARAKRVVAPRATAPKDTARGPLELIV
ncbi:MAG: hypothetical protein AAFU79_30225, partial [Myxococcota bacterium]